MTGKFSTVDRGLTPLISREVPDWALPLLPLDFFRHYWQYVAGPVPELVAPAVLLDLAATPGVEIRFKRPGVPLMHLKSYQIDAIRLTVPLLRTGEPSSRHTR